MNLLPLLWFRCYSLMYHKCCGFNYNGNDFLLDQKLKKKSNKIISCYSDLSKPNRNMIIRMSNTLFYTYIPRTTHQSACTEYSSVYTYHAIRSWMMRTKTLNITRNYNVTKHWKRSCRISCRKQKLHIVKNVCQQT